jgi:hypothetical protein
MPAWFHHACSSPDRNFAMVAAAKRDDELVAHFAPECGLLRKSKVMRVGRLTPTYQARTENSIW